MKKKPTVKTVNLAGRSIEAQLRSAIADYPESRYVLSQRSKVSQGVLSRFIAKERSITLDTAAALCRVLRLELRPIRTKKKER